MSKYFRVVWAILVLVLTFSSAPSPRASNADDEYGTVLATVALNLYSDVSLFGPHRTYPELGTPSHAYSPFEDSEDDTGPPGDDFIPRRVLIKLKPRQHS